MDKENLTCGLMIKWIYVKENTYTGTEGEPDALRSYRMVLMQIFSSSRSRKNLYCGRQDWNTPGDRERNEAGKRPSERTA